MTKTEKFCVLVLDDDICLTTVVTKALSNGLPQVEVLTARTVAEAQLLLAEFKIHFFILDVNLPDGDGIDFLCDVRTLFPDARVMMVTSSPPMPQQEQKTKELGVLLYRQKPVDMREMVQLVRAHYESLDHVTALQNAEGTFAVSLTCLSALDIIQLKCLASATLVLQIVSPHGIGRIHFEDGEITHAESPDHQGADAFEQILRWKGGRIKELPAPAQAPERTIHTGWQGLLLNVAQRIDEAAPIPG